MWNFNIDAVLILIISVWLRPSKSHSKLWILTQCVALIRRCWNCSYYKMIKCLFIFSCQESVRSLDERILLSHGNLPCGEHHHQMRSKYVVCVLWCCNFESLMQIIDQAYWFTICMCHACSFHQLAVISKYIGESTTPLMYSSNVANKPLVWETLNWVILNQLP